MYVSDEYNFGFIHINKTGGRSLTTYLQTVLPDFHMRFGPRAIHKPYTWLEGRGLLTEGYQLLTIVRNPWERYESLYRYRRMRYEQGRPENEGRNYAAATTGFNQWVLNQLSSDNPLDLPQERWLPIGAYAKDKIFYLQLENINQSIAEMFSFFGIKTGVFTRFPHLNRSLKQVLVWNPNVRAEVAKREPYVINRFYRGVYD